MRAHSPYRYHLLVKGSKLGPYDRRTVVGMRIKKLIDNNVKVTRSDGHDMTVAQLVADRFERTSLSSLQRQIASPPASGIWPSFLIDCGGNMLQPGALGLTGKGELRFQGEHLRITATRKSGLIRKQTDRVKLLLISIASAYADSEHPSVIVLRFKPGFPSVPEGVSPQARIKLDDAHAVAELLELMDLPA
jgi:hypothetical protein